MTPEAPITVVRLGIVSAIALAALAEPAFAFTKTSLSGVEERQAIERVVSRFLRAFENLDMTTFIGCFAEDATVFFPLPEPPQRFAGKATIRAHFEQVFATIRETSTSLRPPYHRLIPEDLLVQQLSPNAAVVSFHLRNRERIARRTLVLQKVGKSWLIVHLHASNVPVVRTQ